MASTNRSGTFFYSPDIKVYIQSTALGKTLDVSQDITDFNISRSVNATSTASITLANPDFKYTPGRKTGNWNATVPIETMDKIIIYLKRVKYLQVFSGYVTLAPILTLIPQPVQIQAHCTLYTVQNTYWDPNIPENQQKIPGMLMSQGVGNLSAAAFNDGGAGQGITNLLVDIAGWDKKNIFIGAIPEDWVKQAVNVQKAFDSTYDSGSAKDKLMRAVDGGGLMAGQSIIRQGDSVWQGDFVVNNNVVVSTKAATYGNMQAATAIPKGASLNATLVPDIGWKPAYGGDGLSGAAILRPTAAEAAKYYAKKAGDSTWKWTPGSLGDFDNTAADSINPVKVSNLSEDWWCVLPWEYDKYPGIAPTAKSWLRDAPGTGVDSGRLILLTSIANGNQVIVRASIKGKVGKDNNKIALSRKAWSYLAGDPVETSLAGGAAGTFYTNIDVQVSAVWADPAAGVGIQDSSQLVETLNQFGVTLGRTTAQKESKLANNVTMTVQEWISLALRVAGLPTNRTNTILMAEWIRKEAAAMNNKNTTFEWDSFCNPLNMNWPGMTDKGTGGNPSFPNLYVAALCWALAINPPDNFPTAGASALQCQYPEIRAAFSDNLDHIRKPGWTKARGYQNQYYFSMFIGVCPQTITILGSDANSHTYDFNNELETGDRTEVPGLFWYQNANSDEEKFTLRREVLSQAILSPDGSWQGRKPGYYSLGNTETRGMFNPGNQRDTKTRHNKGSSIDKKDFTINWHTSYGMHDSFRVNGMATANLWKKFIDDDLLPIVGKTQQQGANVGNNGANATRNARIDKFIELITVEDIPPGITDSTANSNYVSQDGGTAFNIAFNGPQLDPTAMALFGTPRGFVTDEPMMGTIGNLATSTLRNFMSAPNGDFVCWFPDYFGMYGQMPTLDIYDVEIVDFSIYHDDTPIATHVAVAGDPYTLGASTNLVQWMESNGIISVQMDEILQQLFGDDYDTVKDLLGPGGSNFLNRYGMRPRIEAVPMIRSHVTEFMYAWRTFMMTWAAQYSTAVQFTFMPELYPGMRVRLADHNIELYVQNVNHNGSRSSGFSTSATLTCPIIRGADKKVKMMHYGFPYSG